MVKEITVYPDGGIEVVEAVGELDMSNVALLDDALKAALSNDSSCCLLDLSGLAFLDSSVINALVRWSRDVQADHRGALAVCVGRHTPAARLVELVGLDDRLPIFTSRDGAKTALVEEQRA